jgi:glycosyltransferase involved in cell wall biosynthesis
MRIAHVTATFPPYYGGTGMVCYHNALGLAKLGHQVTVFTADYPPGDCVYPGEITVRRLPVTFRIGNAPLLPGLLEIKEFDIVHLHYPFIFGAEMIWAVSRACRIPYVITHHNDLIGDGLRRHLFDAYSAVSTRLVFGAARKLVVVSLDHAASCRLAPLFSRQWAKVVEIPNGVDTDLFRLGVDGTPVRQQYAIPADARVMLFVGTLDRAHHYRRVDLLLRAVKVVQDRALHVLVVGNGDQMPEYQKLAQRLGVRSRVRFLGTVAHQALPGVYGAADLVVLPSQLQESFGLVLIEAMACGKPVIASKLPGVRTVVNDGQDGLLIIPGSVDDLAEKIHMLLDDPQHGQEMGEQGRAKVEAQYAWSRIIPKLARVYQDALSTA